MRTALGLIWVIPLAVWTDRFSSLKFSVFTRDKNAKVSGEVQGMLDEDGTNKISTTVKGQVDILDFSGITASFCAKMAAEAGLSPAEGKVAGSTGLKVSTRGGVQSVMPAAQIRERENFKFATRPFRAAKL